MVNEITRRQIFDIWISNGKNERFDAVLTYTKNNYLQITFSEAANKDIKSMLRSLCQKFEEKWAASSRHLERFLNSNATWLATNIKLPNSALLDQSTSSHSNRPGRPKQRITECCDRTKKRKIKSLLESASSEEIEIANECNLRKVGKRDSAAIVKEWSSGSPNIGTKIKKNRQITTTEPESLSPDEALGMIVDANLSTHQYNIIRERVNKLAKNVLPSYDKIKEAKKHCYPLQNTISESSAECDLQALVDHTTKRLCLAQREVLSSVAEFKTGVKELLLTIKWGCDGAQQKRYKQKFESEDQFDENLFSTSMVPIQMSFNDGKQNIILWQNPAPSSTRYCRPIKLNFAKETTTLINDEVQSIQQKISQLSPVQVYDDDFYIMVKPVFKLTMIDGKVCTALSNVTSSSQTCYICGAKPSQMNKPDVIAEKSVDEVAMSYGLSPLHSWIRFMESILHIAYRLDIKVWQVRGQQNKDKIKARKELIQRRFRNELGLLVDMPTQQAGNTNDGNTARRFFRNAPKSAEITGINLELIKRFHIILETLGSGFAINLDAFEYYTRDTRELYLKEYAWYNMPVSVHKVLFHGRDVIASSVIPIGQLSEEAQEARNKDARRYREFFARKTSRVDTNTDLLNRLLISSDPYLASLRHVPKKKCSQLESEVLDLLSIPT